MWSSLTMMVSCKSSTILSIAACCIDSLYNAMIARVSLGGGGHLTLLALILPPLGIYFIYMHKGCKLCRPPLSAFLRCTRFLNEGLTADGYVYVHAF